MVAEGAAPVGEVHPREAAQVEVVRVLDHRQRLVRHPQARPDPARAEVAVLSGPERRVEATERAEASHRDGEVVGREPAPVVAAGVVLDIADVDDELGRGRVGVAGEDVHRAPADSLAGTRSGALDEAPQPVRARPAVVVGEREELAFGAGGAGVAGRRRPGVSLHDELEAQALPKRLGDRAEGSVAAVVDDDRLVEVAGVVEGGEALEARAERLRPLIGRNHDRARRLAHSPAGQSPGRTCALRWSSISATRAGADPSPST